VSRSTTGSLLYLLAASESVAKGEADAACCANFQ